MSIVAKHSPILAIAELLLIFVFSVLAKRLAGKSISEMTYFVLSGMYKSSAVAEMGDRGDNRHGPKRGGGLLCPFRGSWDQVWYNVSWAEAYFRTKHRLHPSSHLATTDMGQKLGEVDVPFFLGVAGPHWNTMSHRPRPTTMPSGILIHATVWP